MPTLYSHRNGEEEPPTEPGTYMFEGVFCERLWNYALTYNKATDTVNKIDDEWEHPVSECKGRWWGPIVWG